MHLYNTAFPLVKNNDMNSKHQKSLPWIFSQDIIVACRKKNRLLKKFIKNRTQDNKKILAQFRNQLKSKIRAAEKLYYYNQFIKCGHNMQSTWKVINEILGNNASTSSSIPTSLYIDNTEYANPNVIANKLNDFFSTIGDNLANKIPPAVTSYLD